MAYTFDIRFARSGGLLALVEAPKNTFRWKGSGRLSIDAHGISIVVCRGLLRLFPRTRRVAAAALHEVLREGEGLRVEFADGDSRAIVPFWVRDSQTAAQIVRLLPTTRTVELDHDAAGVHAARFRVDWQALLLLIAALTSLATIGWRISQTDFSTAAITSNPATEVRPVPDSTLPVRAAPEPETAAPPRVQSAPPAAAAPLTEYPPASEPMPDPYATYAEPASLAAPAARASDRESRWTGTPPRDMRVWNVPVIGGVVAIVPEMPIYALAREEMDRFMADAARLIADQADTEEEWWLITVRINNDPVFDDPDLWPLRDIELAVSRAWRDYLRARRWGWSTVTFEREFAETLTARVRFYVR